MNIQQPVFEYSHYNDLSIVYKPSLFYRVAHAIAPMILSGQYQPNINFFQFVLKNGLYNTLVHEGHIVSIGAVTDDVDLDNVINSVNSLICCEIIKNFNNVYKFIAILDSQEAREIFEPAPAEQQEAIVEKKWVWRPNARFSEEIFNIIDKFIGKKIFDYKRISDYLIKNCIDMTHVNKAESNIVRELIIRRVTKYISKKEIKMNL